MSIADTLSLFSGIALFLFGMTLMGDSLKKVAGNSLELIIYKLSNSPLKGILLGTGVTAIIQSSSATSVLVVGFVNSGMMKVKQAISIIMGAIIGTSVTGWIISLSSIDSSANGLLELVSSESITAIIAIIGIIFRMFSKNTQRKTAGDIMLGFAVLMFGMKAMSSSVVGLRESESFVNLLVSFSNPIIGILIGTVFTAIIQSASAAVGILQALSSTGVITVSIALPILMGIAIGASVPVILSALGASSDGKRSAWSYLIIDIVGSVVVSILYYLIFPALNFVIEDYVLNTFSLALINTLFRLLMIILLAPFIKQIEKLMKVIIKDGEEEEKWEEDKLEERFIKYPALALEQTRIIINQMAERVQDNVERACELIKEFDPKKYKKVGVKEEIIDRYADKLSTYLVKVTKIEMTSEENAIASKYLQALVDFERIGDHAQNVADIAKTISENKVSFSSDGNKELDALVLAIRDILAITVDAFINNNVEHARNIEPFEQVIDDLCDEFKSNHIERIRKGKCTLEHGIMFNDLLINYERISDHCENIAVEIIETIENNRDAHAIKTELHDFNKEEFDRLYTIYSERYKSN